MAACTHASVSAILPSKVLRSAGVENVANHFSHSCMWVAALSLGTHLLAGHERSSCWPQACHLASTWVHSAHLSTNKISTEHLRAVLCAYLELQSTRYENATARLCCAQMWLKRTLLFCCLAIYLCCHILHVMYDAIQLCCCNQLAASSRPSREPMSTRETQRISN